MGKILVAKNKQARREGVDLSLKTPGTKSHARLLKRLNVAPGSKSVRSYQRRLSDYGQQLREKQKLRRLYNVSEKKMARYFNQASEKKGNTLLFLIQFLEARLDNVLYRAGFAPTRASARQLVSHGHTVVNSKKITIPSYSVSEGDIISFRREETFEIPYIQSVMQDKNYQPPKWLKRKANTITIVGYPTQEEYKEPVNLLQVVEFYSKL